MKSETRNAVITWTVVTLVVFEVARLIHLGMKEHKADFQNFADRCNSKNGIPFRTEDDVKICAGNVLEIK